jgi:hypothetical protein
MHLLEMGARIATGSHAVSADRVSKKDFTKASRSRTAGTFTLPFP